MASLEERAYDIAMGALDQQERTLVEHRSRAGTLLTAASITASFLGGQAIARHGLSGPIDIALLAYGVTVLLSIYVVLPKRRLVFSLNAIEIYEALVVSREDDRQVARRLAYWLGWFHDLNDPTIRRAAATTGAAGGALIVEIVMLGFGLAVN
jgi:hypothetical protein